MKKEYIIPTSLTVVLCTTHIHMLTESMSLNDDETNDPNEWLIKEEQQSHSSVWDKEW